MFQSFDQKGGREGTPERVAALRARLVGLGADGFLAPRADAHQGETVAPCDERLAYLTGFTGSAGLAIVMTDCAALFVDGRYTLQAEAQVEPSIFEIVPIHETPVAKWVEKTLGEDQALAYDPWLHGRNEIDRLRKATATAGAKLMPLDANPVDAIWEDRPPPPLGAVRVQPTELAGEETAARRRRVGARVAEAGAAAAVLTQPDSLAWLLNIRGGDLPRSPVALGFGILNADGTVALYMEPEKCDGEVRAHLGNEVAIAPPDHFGEGLAMFGDKTVLIDKATCPLWVADQLKGADAHIVWGQDPCVLPKAIKNEAECEGMRVAHRRDGAAMVRFLHWLDTEIAAGTELTEIDVVTALEKFRAADRALLDISFDTICGSGPNGAIVHYRVTRQTNRTLAPGELLLVDSGGQYQDGTTDITRTIAVGPPPEEARRPFTLVLKGMIQLSRTRWPDGVSGRDLDALARGPLWRAGLDYDHGTGHGVGAYLNVHEGPQRLSRKGGDVALAPGMIVSNEPGYYRTGAFGIRIENLVLVTEPSVTEGGEREMMGFETLTLAPIDRRLIASDLLSVDERAWLDDYHARVRGEIGAALGPEGDGVVIDWLDQACAPLD
ncbi:MAG: aminopeptidase P family protein [Paracoccaceae bacterium]|nr:aminopeptidase P family protein [Paracoccaceae bacterium]